MSNKTLSIVTPIYKDSYVAEAFVKDALALNLGNVRLNEIIFVVDGSGSGDEQTIKELAASYDVVTGITLSRNFGQHIAVTAGYNSSTSYYTCMLNVDQQDPVSEIPKLIDALENKEGDIVYGLRNDRKDHYFKTISSRLFNLFLNKL